MNTPVPREKAIFLAAAQIVSPADRSAFLDRECAGDAPLRASVEALLAVGSATRTLDLPAPGPASAPSPGATLALPLPSVPPAGAPIAAAVMGTVVLPQTEKPGDKIGHYKLLEPLGEGGCGTVYLAEQTEPVRRRVAFKVIKLGMDTKEVVARFEAERQALALMDHPGIAKVLDAGATASGRPFFVMELVRGVRITEFCDQRKLPTRARLELFIEVCQAIQHAHQKGIIHRDIKPSNVLVTLQDDAPVPKVIDFGIAKATGQQRLTEKTLFTAVEQFIGTPLYMSPEQAGLTGLDIDTRSDIYSLGVLLYELLTGRTPIDADTLSRTGFDELRRLICEVDPARPSVRVRSLSGEEITTTATRRATESTRLPSLLRGDLDWIVMKCLEKDRARRYDSAAALAADLQRHLDDLPVQARPPGTVYVMRRFARRHRGAVAAVGAVFAALVIGLVLATMMFFRERDARARADTAAIKSQQVADFLKRMLAGVGPSKTKGRDPAMLREILDQTAEKLGKELADQPLVEAELRRVLGKTYEDLDEFAAAETMYRVGLKLRRETIGEDDLEVADLLAGLAEVLDYRDDLPAAEAVVNEAIAIYRHLGGTRHPKVASGLELLSWIQGRTGLLDEAVRNGREALAIQRELSPAHDHEMSSTFTSLAVTLNKLARFAEASRMYDEELRLDRRLHGELHPRVITTMNNMAFALVARGKLEDAMRVAEEARAIAHKLHGGKLHRTSDSLLKATARAQEFRGEHARAEALVIEAVHAATNLFGQNNGYTADGRCQLIRIQVNLGKLDDAAATLASIPDPDVHTDENSVRTATALLALARGEFATAEKIARAELDRLRALRQFPNRQGSRALRDVAWVLHRRGDSAGAEPLLREAIQTWREENADTPEGAAYRAALAEVLLSLPASAARSSEAEKLLRAALATREQAMVANAWELHFTRVLLADALVARASAVDQRGVLVEAAALLERAWPALTGPDGPPAHERGRLRTVAEDLARRYEAAGQPTAAAAWRENAPLLRL